MYAMIFSVIARPFLHQVLEVLAVCPIETHGQNEEWQEILHNYSSDRSHRDLPYKPAYH